MKQYRRQPFGNWVSEQRRFGPRGTAFWSQSPHAEQVDMEEPQVRALGRSDHLKCSNRRRSRCSCHVQSKPRWINRMPTWQKACNKLKSIVLVLVTCLGEAPDSRGDVDFLSPTPQRIALMILVMSDVQFTPRGWASLTAGLCAKAFSLWLWMCIPCPRCKAFIGSFKRVFEGKTQWAAKDIVTPVRRGDDPVVACRMFWDDMLTLHTILLKHMQAPGFFRVPLFRLLSEEEQLLAYGYRFETIATDACV